MSSRCVRLAASAAGASVRVTQRRLQAPRTLDARATTGALRPLLHSRRWDAGLAMLLLAVVGIGAFLSGLELMITAVALPAIVVDLADWTELRAASWIINGYLLVSIVVMPLAGQLADRHGVRRVFLVALVIFIAGSVLGGPRDEPRRADRGAAASRRSAAGASSRSRPRRRRTCSPVAARPRALGRRRAR